MMFATQRLRGDQPAPKNSFQRELEAKMKDRKNRGLSADLSPSDDALDSDDDLLGQYNLTSKSKTGSSWKPLGSRGSPALSDRSSPILKSGYDSPRSGKSSPYSGKSSPYNDLLGHRSPAADERDAGLGSIDMMKTFKTPQKMAAALSRDEKKDTPSPKQRKSKALAALDELGEEGTSSQPRPWQPPSFNQNLNTRDELLKKPSTREEFQKTPSPRTDLRDSLSPRPSLRNTPSPRTDQYRTTQEDHRSSPKPRARQKSLFADSDSDDNARDQVSSHRRKSPSLFDSLDGGEYKKPTPTKRSEREVGRTKNKSPFDHAEKEEASPTPKARTKAKGIFSDDWNEFSKDSSPKPSRRSSKSPGLFDDKKSRSPSPTDRKTPTKDRYKKTDNRSQKTEDESKKTEVRKPGSLLEMMTSNSSVKPAPRKKTSHLASDSDSDDTGRRDGQDRGGVRQKPSLRKSPGQQREEEEKKMAEWNERQAAQSERQSRSKSKTPPTDDRESSVCRDVEQDPGPMKHATSQETEQIKQKEVKCHTGESKLLEQVITSVDSAQTTQQTEPSKTKKPRSQDRKSARVQPRYKKPEVDTGPQTPTDFNSSSDILSVVYKDWARQKDERIKHQLIEKRKLEKEEEEKKKKAQEEKFFEAKASYDGWMEKKKDYISQSARQRRKEHEKQEKEAQEKMEKKKDAETTYKLWKENKDAVIMEQERKKKKEEEEKRKQQQEKVVDKRKLSKSAFSGWKEKKDEKIEKMVMEKRREERKKEQEKLREQHSREREAMEAYKKWMSRKETQEYTQQRRTRSSLTESRPAWSPAGRTIPAGR